jgi:signal transduction histidine kinase
VSPSRHRRSIGRGLSLAYASLVLATAAVTIGSVYWGTKLWLERRVDDSLSQEFDALVEHHDREGAGALSREIERRIEGPERRPYVYIYTERRYERIVGNLSDWPEGLDPEASDRRLSLEINVGTQLTRRRVAVESRSLPDGRHLLVGRDVTDDEQLMKSLAASMGAGLAIAALLAIGGGISMSRRLLGRVEGMNETVLEILGGSAETRVPHVDPGDEFDALARHFNALIDENERLVRRMREVTDDVAHDLRTPLARMRTRIESALASDGGDERSRETLHELMRDADRIIETFNALIYIAKIESHGFREEMSELSLDDVVRDAVDLYRPLAEDAGVNLVERVGEDVTLLGNRHLVSQALVNLIDNAVKYAGESGQVEVAAHRSEGRAELVVTDDGAGIPEPDRARVLERFVRLDESRGRSGSGLGLSFVAAVAEHHGAELLLSDAAPGLRVRLLFPDRGPPRA